jgi:hypothetical protein
MSSIQIARVAFACIMGLLIGIVALRHAETPEVVLWWASGVVLAGITANSANGERPLVLLFAAVGCAAVASLYAVFYGLTHDAVYVSGVHLASPLENPMFRYLVGLLFCATLIGVGLSAAARPVTVGMLRSVNVEAAERWEKVLNVAVKVLTGAGVIYALLAG